MKPTVSRPGGWLRPTVLASYGLLVVLVIAAVVRASSRGAAVAMGVLLLLPLAMPLVGLLRRAPRSAAWATLGVTPCIVYGLTETIANPAARPLAAAVLFASLALFALLVALLNAADGTSQPPSTNA
jgi:uncharacterized membrane protein